MPTCGGTGAEERQGAEEEPRLGREHRHEHLDDERNRDEPRAEAEDQQHAADDFQPAHEVRGEGGNGNPSLVNRPTPWLA